jgi:pimeloyl-ACP methyl ester carboxylesterase/class 3 adenylate cyclase
MSVMAEIPETRFAKIGEDRIAYQVVGEGPPDLLWLSGLGEPIDARWEYPPCASFVRRLASFSRLIMFDRLGVGASDPVSLESLPNWEGWADDALAVLDAVGSTRAVILGVSQGGPAAIMVAATRPERAQALILVNTAARVLQADDYPWGQTPEEADAIVDFIAERWGTEDAASIGAPSLADDPVFCRWIAKSCRMSCSAREIATYIRQDNLTDVRQVLPSIQVPTLVLHRSDAPFLTLDQGRYLGQQIPGARFVSVPGDNLFIFTKPNAQILSHIEDFVTGGAPGVRTDRALAAVLFTDIVGSTERAAALGDRRWSSLLGSHDVLAQATVNEHGGRLVRLTGDGVLATFDGPGRAIRCGFALRDALDPLGITIRAGLHTGEVELRGDDIGGIAVHVAARVLEHAGGGELLVSAAVPLLVAGSGVEFEDRGDYELKGLPGTWKLYAVEG